MLKILSLNTKIVYDIQAHKPGENQMPCPECSQNRKHGNKKKKIFSWNNTKKTGNCVHCGASFVEFKPFKEQKEYKAPNWKNITFLSDKAVKWFNGRMISQSTLNKLKIYTDTEYMPQFEKEIEVICFPYFKDDKLVNIKYRGAQKSFKLFKDAELIFYNFNALRHSEIIITEGEIDCLSLIEVGFENVISVPNGAGSRSLEYLDDCIELFDQKTVILATDNDIKGLELRQELIRRFGQEKCKVVNFNDCKDANEVLQKHGGLELRKCIETALEIPIEGIVNINNQYDSIYDLYVNGLKPGLTTGLSELDNLITWESSRLAVITGIPSHGKSEFLDDILIRLNLKYNWKVAYFSPENYPIQYHFSKISSKLSGKEFNAKKMDSQLFDQVYDYIIDNFFWIYPEDDTTVENILIKAKHLIKKYGIKVLVIDPYNKLEHVKNRNENETEYISRFLDLLTNFAKRNDILVCLVAHPRKMEKQANKKFEIPTLYDINGSANFYNKADYGITVYRYFGDKESPENKIEIHIQKVKFKHLGQTGIIDLRYNYNNGRFESFEKDVNQWNNLNWLVRNNDVQLIPLNSKIESKEDFYNNLEVDEETPF
jgi:twinkle protein